MRRKLKVAIFHCGFIYTGGGERIVLEEVSGLRKLGYRVDCFVPVYEPSLSYPDIIKKYRIKSFLPQLPTFFPFRFAFLMVSSCILAPIFAIRFLKYDVILGANQPGAFIAWIVARLLNKPYFVYLNQPNRILYPRDHEDWQNVKDYYYLDKVINKLFRPFVAFLDRRSIKGGKNIFINGSFVAKEICRNYKISSWVDCPGGAHVSSKKINGQISGKTIKANGRSISTPYILCTSRHEPWKKFDWAIEIAEMVFKKHNTVKLVIPGADTAITKKLKKLTRDLNISDRVIFTGAINQKTLKNLYENAAVYLFTSPNEDLGIVVQEAQAAGSPVVAWNSGGPTVTVKNGKTGFLVQPFKLSLMAKKVLELLENKKLRLKMGRIAKKHIKENFSWDKHVSILSTHFLELKNEKKKN